MRQSILTTYQSFRGLMFGRKQKCSNLQDQPFPAISSEPEPTQCQYHEGPVSGERGHCHIFREPVTTKKKKQLYQDIDESSWYNRSRDHPRNSVSKRPLKLSILTLNHRKAHSTHPTQKKRQTWDVMSNIFCRTRVLSLRPFCLGRSPRK